MATNCRPSGPCQAPCPVLCRAPCREPASTRRHRGRHHGGAQRGGRRLRGAAIHRRGRMLHIRTPRRCNGPPRRPRNRCGHKLQPQLGPRVGPSQAHRPSRATPVAMQAAPQWWTTEWARQTRARQVTSTGVRWLARPRATAWRRCLTPAPGCSVRAPTRRPRSMRLRSCSPLGPAPISTLHPAPRRPTRLGLHLSRTTSPLMRRRPRMWRRPVPTLRLAPRVAASSTRTVGRQYRQAAFLAPPRSKLAPLDPLRACACIPQPFRRSAVPSKSTSTPDCKCSTVDQPSVLAPLSSPSSSAPLPQSAAQPRDAPARFGGPLHAERVSANTTRAPGVAQSAHGEPFMPPAEAPPLASHAGHASASVPAASFDLLEELPLNSDVEERASLESADGVSVPSRSRRSSRSLSRRDSADVASLSAESPLSLHRDSAAARDEQPAAEDATKRIDTPTCSEGEGPSEGEQHDSGAVAESAGADALAPRRNLGSQLLEEPLAPAASHAPVERPSMSQASAMAKFKSAAAAVGCAQAVRQSTAGGAAPAPAAVPLSTLSLGAKKSSAVHRPAIAQKIMRLGASGSDSDGSSTEVPGAAFAPRVTGDDDSDFD